MARRRLTVKRIDPWSVLKFGAVANLALLAIGLLVFVVAWFIIERVGIVDQVCEIALDVGFTACGVNAGNLFRAVVLLGLLGVVIQTAVLVFLSFLHNLIADLTGGLTLSVIDDSPAPARAAGAATATGVTSSGRIPPDRIAVGSVPPGRTPTGDPRARDPRADDPRARDPRADDRTRQTRPDDRPRPDDRTREFRPDERTRPGRPDDRTAAPPVPPLGREAPPRQPHPQPAPTERRGAPSPERTAPQDRGAPQERTASPPSVERYPPARTQDDDLFGGR